MKIFNQAISKKREIRYSDAVFRIYLAALFVLTGNLRCQAAAPKTIDVLPLEQMAYVMPLKENFCSAWKKKYLQMLSPGGKAYFLANRRTYDSALVELEKLPGPQSGSRLYVKAFCLQGLGRCKEAVQVYVQAKAKTGLVFNPGSKFFFHMAAAQLQTGDWDGCLKSLETASHKSAQSQRYQRSAKIIRDTAARRKFTVMEKRGQYKEAFEGYLQLFPEQERGLLTKPLTGDTMVESEATLWLKNYENQAPPKEKEKRANFFLKAGAAHLRLGNLNSAIRSFEQVISIEPYVRNRIETETARVEVGTVLGKCRDAAKGNLVRIYFSQKKFSKCCSQIRSMFLINPLVDPQFWLCSISMDDVPELVRQEDVNLHSMTVEHLLDERLLEAFGPSRVKYTGPNPFVADSLLKKAGSQIQKKSFSECFDTLQLFIDTNERFCVSKAFDTAPERTASFMQDFDYKARLLQQGAAMAAGKIQTPSRLQSDLPLYKHADWDAIENNLLGIYRKKNTKNDQTLSKPDFLARWHFASAVYKMHLKEYRSAAEDFKLAAANSDADKDVSIYSDALHAFCLSKQP